MDEMEAEATSATAGYQADEEAKSEAKSSSEQASRLKPAREDNDGSLAVEGANDVATKPVVADSTELVVTALEEMPIVVAKQSSQQRRSSRSRVPTPDSRACRDGRPGYTCRQEELGIVVQPLNRVHREWKDRSAQEGTLPF